MKSRYISFLIPSLTRHNHIHTLCLESIVLWCARCGFLGSVSQSKQSISDTECRAVFASRLAHDFLHGQYHHLHSLWCHRRRQPYQQKHHFCRHWVAYPGLYCSSCYQVHCGKGRFTQFHSYWHLLSTPIFTLSIQVLVLFPLMRNHGYALDWKDALVLVYGGLRGAIALALALITNLDTGIDEKVRQQIMFLTSGIVLLTLLINASTIRYMLVALGMDTYVETSRCRSSNLAQIPCFNPCVCVCSFKPESARVYNSALEHLKNEEMVMTRALKHDRHYAAADWASLRSVLPDFDELRKKVREDGCELDEEMNTKGEITKGNGRRRDTDSKKSKKSQHSDTDFRCLVKEIRLRLISGTKAAYWQQFEEGLMSKQAVTALVESAERALDVGSLAKQWHAIEPEFNVPFWLSAIYSSPYLKRISKRFLFKRLAFAVELATAFVEATQR